MKHWRKLAALCLAGIMVFALAACTQEPEEEPTETEKPTETTAEPAPEIESPTLTVDPETFRDYIGTWYADGSSAGYRIVVKEDAAWVLTDASEEVVSSGTLRVNDEEELLELYDPDGSLAVTISIEEAGVLHVDIMLESLTDTLSTNTFLNKITNDISDAPPTDIEDSTPEIGPESEEVAPPPIEEDITG